jgi:hypothetical protein
MKNLTRFALFALLVTSLAACALGQSSISDEKRKLIAQLLLVNKTEENSLKATDALMEMLESIYPATVKSALEKMTDPSDKEREDMEKTAVGHQLAVSRKMRARLPEVINIKQLLEEIYYPLYDKYYTESELKDLIVFYSSPTGKKVIENMTPFFVEAMKSSQEKLYPKILKLNDDVIKEELNEVRPAVAEKKKN